MLSKNSANTITVKLRKVKLLQERQVVPYVRKNSAEWKVFDGLDFKSMYYTQLGMSFNERYVEAIKAELGQNAELRRVLKNTLMSFAFAWH